MDDIKLFAQFTKKNDDQQIVEGFASSEALDSQGEVVKITAIEKALPDYMKFGNVREMHQWSAVGKAISTSVDKAKKRLYLTAKVVDPVAWEKVKAGVYNGFSIGGRVIKRIDNAIEELALSEISLVDRPANPEAVFTMVKIKDGKNGTVKCEDCVEAPEPMPHQEISYAAFILDLAIDIRMLLMRFKDEGRSTVDLERALTTLKTLAAKILTEEESKKFDKILYGVDFKELEKLNMPNIKVAAEKKQEADIKKFVDHNWQDGYFTDLKKVL